MYIISFCILIIVLWIIPLIIGYGMLHGIKKGYTKLMATWYVTGVAVMLGVFQLLTVPFTLLEISFSLLVVVYLVVLILLSGYYICRYRKSIFNKMRVAISNIQWSECYFIFALILILFQMIIPVIRANYIGADDALYIAYSNDIVYYDSIFTYFPYTGEYVGVGVNKMTLTSWCVFVAYLAKITNIHVATIAHTFLPFWVIAISYMVYYLIGRILMRSNFKKVCCFLIVLSVIHIWGNISSYTITLRLLQCQWHGKAVAAIFFTPLIFYMVYVMFSKKTSLKECLVLILITLGATGTTLIGTGLAVLTISVECLVLSIMNRDWKVLMRGVLCCLPCASYAIVFVFQYYFTALLKGF